MIKILNESKIQLPITYLTNFVSRGWEEIGMLKEEIEAIKKEFKDVKKIEDCVGDLIDAYLVCVGKIEGILDNKKYIEFPEEPEALKESVQEEIKPDLEAIDIIKSKVALKDEGEDIALVPKDQLDDEDADKLILEVSEEEQDILESEFNDEYFDYVEKDEGETEEGTKINHEPVDKSKDDFEPFEYFCDFD